jgi:DsbE subfamily thiol:disulfide oxidoreductase
VDSDLMEARREREEAKRRTEHRRGMILLALLGVGAALIAYTALRQFRVAGGATTFSIADYQAEAQRDRRPVPQFREPALGGGTIDWGDYSGKVVVVNFWASWCGPCRREAPALQRLWEEYRDRGVRFLGVDFKDDAAAARAYEEEFGITYPSVFDPSGKVAYDFQVLALPTTYVVGRDGWIAYHFTGIITEPLLRKSIEDVMEGASQ